MEKTIPKDKYKENLRWKVHLFKGSITNVQCDVIVNAANSSLRKGGGVDGAIRELGGPSMEDELKNFSHCEIGDCVVTMGHGVTTVKYVFHTVGPNVKHGAKTPTRKQRDELKNCYINCLNKAKELRLKSICFPAISAGIFGYPKQQSSLEAIKTVIEWFEINEDFDLNVLFMITDRELLNFYEKNLCVYLPGCPAIQPNKVPFWGGEYNGVKLYNTCTVDNLFFFFSCIFEMYPLVNQAMNSLCDENTSCLVKLINDVTKGRITWTEVKYKWARDVIRLPKKLTIMIFMAVSGNYF